jgi:hypothetical protein
MYDLKLINFSSQSYFKLKNSFKNEYSPSNY